MALIELKNLSRFYSLGGETVKALNDLTLSIEAGEFVAVMGPSGSGKSTFMNLAGCLDRPTAGAYRPDGQEMSRLNADQLAHVRRPPLGVLFPPADLPAR